MSDFTIYDIDDDGMDEIITIGKNEDGTQRIASYRWSGFGFELIHKSGFRQV